MRVLVVDDEPIAARLLQAILKTDGHDGVVASTGPEALERLREPGDWGLFILDVLMPGMDGFTLLHAIRSRGRWNHVPVLMCTAQHDSQSVHTAMDLSCDGYVVKPFRADELRARIAAVMRDASPVLLQAKTVTRALGIDLRAYQRLTAEYMKDILTGIDALQSLPAERINDPSFRAIVNRLVANAEKLGAPRVGRVGKQLVELVETGHPLSTVAPLIDALVRELQRLHQELQAA